MEGHLLYGISLIIGLGIAAQWLAWRMHLPGILILLLFGILAGPVFGILNPDALFGDSIIPLVSLSVGIILFEGGLDLRLSELEKVGGIVRNLVTMGLLVTWIFSAASAYYIFDMDFSIAILLGAILVVTGPTVIIPLLRHIRLTGKSIAGTTLKWEGIVIDPIGAVFAVLVLEVVLSGGLDGVWMLTFKAVVHTLLVGGFFGALAAALIIVLFRYHLVPDYLKNSLALAVLVVSFVVSNEIQHESGLLTTTLMGVFLANQKFIRIKQIVEFKETLRVLLISCLFILLSARMEMEAFYLYGYDSAIYVLVLVFFVRPLSVLCSTYRSELNFKERIFLCSVAPRGIVAASVASIFALELSHRGVEGSEVLLPVTFMVIIGTVLIYGLFSPVVARALGMSRPNPQGLMIVGAHTWSRQIAKAVQDAGSQVFLVDTNSKNIELAKEEGLSARNMNVVFDPEVEDLVLDGIGRLVALTPNDEVNTLAAIHFEEIFGPTEIYQLAPQGSSTDSANVQSARGRILFSEDSEFFNIQTRFNKGAKIESIVMQEEFNMASLKQQYGDDVMPLFAVKSIGDISTFTAASQPKQLIGSTLVCLVGGGESQPIV